MKLFTLGNIKKGSAIKLIARAEGTDGTIGDAVFIVEPGGSLFEISYNEIFKQLGFFGFLDINTEKELI